MCIGNDGFTLAELLVVSLLLAVVSLTAYAGMAGGVRIWKRIDASVKEVDLALEWKRFRKDLVGQVPFQQIGFRGADDEVAFPGLVTVLDNNGVPHEEVGRVRYRFDAANRQLCREELTYAEAAKGIERCRPVLSEVGKVTFAYFGAEEGGGAGNWRTDWEGAQAPLAVRMRIAWEGTGGKIAKQYTVTLP
ncbi:MAG: prepilin-type N-terminal cleavage/methylation domain-containing protein [Deltaproteobacteria bacterium]|nr:prepilin-type N-terminal cleavage/methylation domain-containing protein [Deltaproteobacteria bacterium]